MDKKRTDLLRGTLDLLILKSLALEPLHGVGVSRRITQITRGAFRVSFGSLFPSLHRMEEKGWVEAEWRASENNRRAKYYRLTSSGRAQLMAEERDWSQVVKIMTAAVEFGWEASCQAELSVSSETFCTNARSSKHWTMNCSLPWNC